MTTVARYLYTKDTEFDVFRIYVKYELQPQTLESLKITLCSFFLIGNFQQ